MFHQPIVRHRYFFALLPPPVEARRIAHAVASWFASGTPVRSDRLHITMAIFPDADAVPSELERTLRTVGGRVTAAAIAVTLDRISGGARSIALRPSRRIAGLEALHHDIDANCRGLGLAPRPGYTFDPHMTLGYRTGAPLGKRITPVAWIADALVLIHSHVGLTRHEIVDRWPLAADRQLSLW